MTNVDDDEIRTRLLDAARRVFAEQGYEGTRIGDIVREAGLSTGAVYSRFRSKNDLLREAVVGHAAVDVALADGAERVADVVERHAAWFDAPLTLDEAVRLEAHVAARREPEVARAIEEAQDRWRESVEPLLARPLTDGTIADDVDPEAVLFFVRTMSLGLLLQRAAGHQGARRVELGRPRPPPDLQLSAATTARRDRRHRPPTDRPTTTANQEHR